MVEDRPEAAEDTQMSTWENRGVSAFFFVCIGLGAATALELVYGTIFVGINLGNALKFPVALVVMVVAVAGWAMIFAAVVDGLHNVYRRLLA